MKKTHKKNSGAAPAYQMYPRDWNENTRLKACSYAAQGLWIRLCNTSYFMEKSGVFSIENHQLSEEKILDLLPGKSTEKKKLFGELKQWGVIKRFEDGTFYCKRIYEDMKLRAIRKEAGKQGGNPNLIRNLDNQKTNQKSKKGVKQKPTPSSSSSISLSSTINSTTLASAFDEFWKSYPKKTGKVAAEKKFKSLKLTGEELTKLQTAAKNLTAQAEAGKFVGEKGQLQFCPNPLTWLNQGRYLDEPEPQGDTPQANQYGTHEATEAEIADLERQGLI